MESASLKSHSPNRKWITLVLAFYAVWCLRVVVLLPVDNKIHEPALRQAWGQGLRFLLWILPVVLYATYVDRTSWLAFLRLNRTPRRPLQAVALSAAFLTLITICSCFLQGGRLKGFLAIDRSTWISAVVWTLYVALAEEVLFRGFIYRKLRDTRSFAKANLQTSVLFVLIHWPGWLYIRGCQWNLVELSVGILFASLVFGALLELTESLWPPILLHTLNNLFSMALSFK